MANVVVLGGGISGLSCAYYLSKLGKEVIKKVTLLEHSTRLGGWISSTRFPDGTIYEQGPRSMRVHGNAGFNSLFLADELGLSSEILPVTTGHPATTRRMILFNKQLNLLPSGFKNLFQKQAPFSKPISYVLLKDWFTKKSNLEDETVYDFASRRFGQEVAQFIFDPLCRGVMASDSKILSVKSVFPALFEGEQKYGSVIKSQIKGGNVNQIIKPEFVKSDLVMNAKVNKWSMWTLRNGLQSLPDKMTEALEQNELVQLFTNMPCDRIHFENGTASVHFEGEGRETDVDHIFAAIPAKSLSKLVGSHHHKLAKHLSSITTVTVAVVNLEYKGKVLKHQGFGFLVPSTEKSNVLGITFDSCCFPEQDGKYSDKTRLTCMMGGHWFEELFGPVDSVTSDVMLQHAVDAAAEHLEIKDQPVQSQVSIHRHCIPEYKLGHDKLVSKMKSEIEDNKMPLTLLGSSYSGISVNECIYNAKLAVENYVKALA